MGDMGMGMPPEGGAPMPPEAGGEAAPPAPAPGGAPPAPTAETLHRYYKTATQTMNEIAFNRTSLASLSEQQFSSATDKELNERFAVTGRAHVGELPEDLDPVEPWEYMPCGTPLNYLAKREIRTAKVKEKQVMHGYTGLEKQLYNIVMQMGTPFAFYAQYEAGPSKEYILDGAFPAIKLGVEADGEVWHNNNNKIQSDRQRDINLSRQGWTILRFTDKEIQRQPQDVAMVIKQAMQKLMQIHGFGNGSQQTL